MAGKMAELGGKNGICRNSFLASQKQLKKLDLSHPLVMASATKPLVKIRYEAGTLKHLAVLPLARAASIGKRLF